jgi:uncharacterized protein (TIGR03437 family)
MRSVARIASFSILLCLPIGAQTASIVHVGYQASRPVSVAPGQVVHLELHGLRTTFDTTPVAQSIPLPVSFNGLSVSLQQSNAPPEMLPLLRLDTVSSCNSSAPPVLFGPLNTVACTASDTTYDLWVQIPFDLTPTTPGLDQQTCFTPGCVVPGATDAVLTVTETSGTDLSLRILPVVDQIHILNSCTDNIGTVGLEGASVYASYACVAAITHSNNSWVTAANPARPGEELIAYAFGMGALGSTLFNPTGGIPAGGLPITRTFTISFPGIASQTGTRPDYVGVVGGNPGLYQINFHVPAVPATLAPCTAPPGPSLLSTLPFNFTMTLVGTASMDQASFCVQP